MKTGIRPRWRKVISDVWDSKARTILVVLSIAVGVFAVGMIVGAYYIMSAWRCPDDDATTDLGSGPHVFAFNAFADFAELLLQFLDAFHAAAGDGGSL